MADYDFRALNDKEFEAFCADLLGEIHKTRFERFKPGRDRGVDARCLMADGSEIVVQCKHRPQTSLTALIRFLHEKERPKVDRLKPSRYVLCLSNPLSRHDKRKIAEAMAPHIKSDADILGAEDLNDALDKYPDVIERQYKLWLCSAKVLSTILDKPIFERSAFTLAEAQEAAKRYVLTEGYEAALKIIGSQGILIVSGEPGVGKTSLAEHIALYHAVNGYEFFKILEDITEAERVFRANKPQIFYFDDFLGGNYLQALSGHEGNHIANFIRRMRKDPTKRFILTSRTTILNRGKMLIDTFEKENLKTTEYVLNVSSYTEMEKAQILYSHLWHSTLDEAYIDEIYKTKRYRTIIEHGNFNPRLISFITNSDRIADRPARAYWKYVQETLNEPANVWEHPYNAQLDDFGRLMVLLVAINGRAISEKLLADAYSQYCSLPQGFSMSGSRDFSMTLRHLTGSLLTRSLSQEKAAIARLELFNPSIGDYVLRRHAHDTKVLEGAFLSLRSIASLRVLFDLTKNELIESHTCVMVLRSILKSAGGEEFVGYPASYIASALIAYIRRTASAEHRSDLVTAALDFVLEDGTPTNFTPLVRVMGWGLENGCVSGERALGLIVDALKIGADDEELRELARLHNLVPDRTKDRWKVGQRLREAVIDCVEGQADSLIDASELFSNVNPFDDEEVEEKLEEMLCTIVEDFGVDCDASDVRDIAQDYDVSSHRKSYLEEAPAPRREEVLSKSNFQVPKDDVDELFDRER